MAKHLPVRGLFRFIATFVVMVSLVSCTNDQTSDRVLRLALKTSPNRLDPAVIVDAAEGEIAALLFQGLVRFSSTGVVVADAAASWTIEDGATRYVFKIDPNARFSSGRPVQAEDVVFSFRRVLSPETRAPRPWVLTRIRGAAEFAAGTATTITGLHAPDAGTIIIELDDPFAPFLSMLALPAAMIVDSKLLENDTGVPGGSGAWQLAAWERGDYVSLTPNPYSPFRATGFDEIRMRIIPEAFTRIAEYESGSLDVLEIPMAEVRRYLDDATLHSTVRERSELRVFYIGLNNQRGPLKDVRVRRALNMSVDIDQLISVLAAGEATRATGSIPPGLRGYRDRPAYPFDPEAARGLLREAGYPDGFPLEIWQRASPEGNRVLEAIQAYLGEVGIEVTLVRREWSAFKEAVSTGKVDAFFLDWFADYPDAENFIYPLFHSNNVGGGGNRAFFRDEQIDSMITAANATVDPDARAAAYAEIDERIYGQAPWLYLYFPKSFHAVSDRVIGYTLPTLYLGSDYSAIRIQ